MPASTGLEKQGRGYPPAFAGSKHGETAKRGFFFSVLMCKRQLKAVAYFHDAVLYKKHHVYYSQKYFAEN